MLEMKTACERCHAVLRLDAEAYICSYECTFCGPCTFGDLEQVCPNCEGDLSRRPKRTKENEEKAKTEAKSVKKQEIFK